MCIICEEAAIGTVCEEIAVKEKGGRSLSRCAGACALLYSRAPAYRRFSLSQSRSISRIDESLPRVLVLLWPASSCRGPARAQPSCHNPITATIPPPDRASDNTWRSGPFAGSVFRLAQFHAQICSTGRHKMTSRNPLTRNLSDRGSQHVRSDKYLPRQLCCAKDSAWLGFQPPIRSASGSVWNQSHLPRGCPTRARIMQRPLCCIAAHPRGTQHQPLTKSRRTAMRTKAGMNL